MHRPFRSSTGFGWLSAAEVAEADLFFADLTGEDLGTAMRPAAPARRRRGGRRGYADADLFFAELTGEPLPVRARVPRRAEGRSPYGPSGSAGWAFATEATEEAAPAAKAIALRAHVRTRAGRGIEGAEVRLRSGSLDLTRKTDANGFVNL